MVSTQGRGRTGCNAKAAVKALRVKCGVVSEKAVRRRRSVCVRAVAEDGPKLEQVVKPLNGDPFVGMLETPVTSSPIVANYLSNLPAYRIAVSPLLRGVEIGLAHGFFLVGPFIKVRVSLVFFRRKRTHTHTHTHIFLYTLL